MINKIKETTNIEIVIKRGKKIVFQDNQEIATFGCIKWIDISDLQKELKQKLISLIDCTPKHLRRYYTAQMRSTNNDYLLINYKYFKGKYRGFSVWMTEGPINGNAFSKGSGCFIKGDNYFIEEGYSLKSISDEDAAKDAIENPRVWWSDEVIEIFNKALKKLG